jgi:hypothetical protein
MSRHGGRTSVTTSTTSFRFPEESYVAPPNRHLEILQAIRAEARTLLAQVAEESGPSSRLYRLCVELWHSREADAYTSLRYGDAINAVLIMKRAVELMALGPSVVARNELDLDDLELLLRAA